MEGRGKRPELAPMEDDAVFKRAGIFRSACFACASVEDSVMSKATKGSHCNLCK